MVVIYTLLTGPTLPWVAAPARGDPARRAARPRGRGRAAGADRGRPAAGQHHPQVPAARRRGRRAAAAGRARRSRCVVRDGQTLVPDQRTVLRRGDDMLVVTPRKCREATEDAAAGRVPRGRLARLARTAREPEPATSAGRSQRWRDRRRRPRTTCCTTITRLRLGQLVEACCRRPRRSPGPRSVSVHAHLGRPCRTAGRPAGAAASFCSVVHTCTRLTVRAGGRVADLARREPALASGLPASRRRGRTGCRR